MKYVTCESKGRIVVEEQVEMKVDKWNHVMIE